MVFIVRVDVSGYGNIWISCFGKRERKEWRMAEWMFGCCSWKE